jgi:D-sedoheptulose 7-phosphate isomerase
METWSEYLAQHNEPFNTKTIASKIEDFVGVVTRLVEDPDAIIFTLGNGGSATTADHFAADLSLMNVRVQKIVRAVCLNSQLGLNTALSNDISYAEALSTQIRNFPSKKHLLVCFSASGNSENILRAAEVAHENGQEVWAFVGFDGGEILKSKNFNVIHFETRNFEYGKVENLHLIVCHFIIDSLKLRFELGSPN